MKELLDAAADEARTLGARGVFVFNLDLVTLTGVVAFCQLALRHPDAATRATAAVVRRFIDEAIDKLDRNGFKHTAQVCRLGNNPQFDTRREKP